MITSPLLRARHGFPTRAGGVSRGPLSSLNASFAVGDLTADVAQNLARLASAAQVDPSRLITLRQVHGLSVVRAQTGPELEGDAVWTDEPHMSVAVRTADCVPVLFEDARSGRVAAAHAGWRGVLGGIASLTLEALVAAGSRLGDLRVAIGPCIQRCCFEVDGDLPERFSNKFGTLVVVPAGAGARVHLDLPLALQSELKRAGVGEPQVAVLPHCTHCDPRFFSHRRDRGVTGRHLSFISCEAEAMERARPRPFS